MNKLSKFTSTFVVVFSLLNGITSAETIHLDLAKVLQLAGANSTEILMGRERVTQAKLDRNIAWYNWLPDVRIGGQWAEQEGFLQNTNGIVERVERESFSSGLGFTGTGSGLASNPGLSLEVDLADAFYGPRISSRKLSAARHGEAETNAQVLLKAADLYYDLVAAQRMIELVETNKSNASELAMVTRAFAESGQGLIADSEQAMVYSMLIESGLENARYQQEAAKARLIQFLKLDKSADLKVMETSILPLDIYSEVPAYSQLVNAALSIRPELKEAEALMDAAEEEYELKKWGPLLPKLAAHFSDGEFEGNPYGMNSISGDRTSYSVAVFWEIKGLGLSSYSNSLKQKSTFRQASALEAQVRADVSAEVKFAMDAIIHSKKQLTLLENAVERARNAFVLTRDLVFENQGLPLEAMQAMRMLEDTEKLMLQAAKRYNMAQLQLQTVSGKSISSSSLR